jgi:phenylpyruvate tautomerase PptA (4-oxalocrotonate tautomerase family)
MPIIDIELVGPVDGPPVPGLAQAVADDLGKALGAQAGKVWVRLRTLSPTNYAENEAKSPHPAFVSVLAAAPPAGDELHRQVSEITAIVARHTGRPRDLVHVLFEPAARGRIAFGGRLVE